MPKNPMIIAELKRLNELCDRCHLPLGALYQMSSDDRARYEREVTKIEARLAGINWVLTTLDREENQ